MPLKPYNYYISKNLRLCLKEELWIQNLHVPAGHCDRVARGLELVSPVQWGWQKLLGKTPPMLLLYWGRNT